MCSIKNMNKKKQKKNTQDISFALICNCKTQMKKAITMTIMRWQLYDSLAEQNWSM